MNLIKNTAQQLVRRRLWPVAVLLLAALVAVPMTLAKSPAPVPAAPAGPAKTAGSEDVSQAVVQLSDTTAGDKRRRRVLGVSKDPFEPAPLPKVKKKHKKKVAAASATPTATPDASSSGSGAGGAASPVATPVPVPTVSAPKGSVRVRFGVSTPGQTTQPDPALFGHLDALPSADDPVLALEGLKSGGKTAVFSIPGQVTAVGDGVCRPRTDACETLELKAGETEFITVKGEAADGSQDVQYELDVLNVFDKTTKIPASSVGPSAAGGGNG